LSRPYLNFISGLSFLSLIEKLAVPVQLEEIAYQSSDNEFGWTWYQSADAPIEGLHRCAALLEIPAKVAYLRVAVDLITDWRRFGAWKKLFDFQVPVTAGKS
jgi:hypothetical protein